MRTLAAVLRRHAKLVPAEFLALTPEQKADIKRARIVPPKLGDPGFGHVEVTYKTPRYVAGGERSS